MNNVNEDETCRCKFVDRWIDAHEKYFHSLTIMQEDPKVQYFSEPLPFIPNNTQAAYAVLQYAMPNTAQPKTQTNCNAAQIDAVEPRRAQRSSESNAAQAKTQSHAMGPSAVQPKAVRPNEARSNPAPYLNRSYAALPPFAVQSPFWPIPAQPHSSQQAMQPNAAQPHSTQQAVQPNAAQPNSNQPNAMRPNPAKLSMYIPRPDLVVQPPHRISPLKWKKTAYVHNF